jgi:hypothetical protein
MEEGINLAGIPVPSHEPWFLATVGFHVLAGIVAVVAGATAMLSPKTAGRHPRAGTVYFRALATVCVTMSALTVARWPADNHLGVLGVLAWEVPSSVVLPAVGAGATGCTYTSR